MERRLKNNPEHAAAYDKQMNKMSAMGFPRKLKENELTSYQGPSHYISCHKVICPGNRSTQSVLLLILRPAIKVMFSTTIGLGDKT